VSVISGATHCRFCEAPLELTVIDLGKSPLCESFLAADQLVTATGTADAETSPATHGRRDPGTPVRADPDRRLRDREGDQLAVTDERPPPAACRDRVLVREDIGCNDKAFQIRHLELQSRGDTGLEALRRAVTGPCEPAAVSHQASSADADVGSVRCGALAG
jgi:hypothetical protein